MKPSICPECGSGLTYYRDHPTEGVCMNDECIHHREPIDYTMPLPDEAFMEVKCAQCDKWQSECQCVADKPSFSTGGFVMPSEPYIVGDGRPDTVSPKGKLDEIRAKIKGLGASLVVNYSQLYRDIDRAESELVAFGWVEGMPIIGLVNTDERKGTYRICLRCNAEISWEGTP